MSDAAASKISVERSAGPASRSVHRAPAPVKVNVADGATVEVTTSGGTVREVLLERDVVLEPGDFVTPDLGTPVTDGMAIAITRVTQSTVSEQVITPFTERTVEDPATFAGTQHIAQAGADGETRNVYTVTQDAQGVELSRDLLLTLSVSEPVEQILATGTKERPAPPAKSAPVAPAAGSAPAAAAVAPGSNRALGQSMAAERGWGEDQFACLDSLWTKESRWDHLAENRSSGAYGIAQSLPGSKMASAGADWRTNPATQITWGLGYISGRYGTPCGAWDHSKAKGWY